MKEIFWLDVGTEEKGIKIVDRKQRFTKESQIYEEDKRYKRNREANTKKNSIRLFQKNTCVRPSLQNVQTHVFCLATRQ